MGSATRLDRPRRAEWLVELATDGLFSRASSGGGVGASGVASRAGAARYFTEESELFLVFQHQIDRVLRLEDPICSMKRDWPHW
jgi:hypothetical protein